MSQSVTRERRRRRERAMRREMREREREREKRRESLLLNATKTFVLTFTPAAALLPLIAQGFRLC